MPVEIAVQLQPQHAADYSRMRVRCSAPRISVWT